MAQDILNAAQLDSPEEAEATLDTSETPVGPAAEGEQPQDEQRDELELDAHAFAIPDSFIPESVDQLLAHSRRYPLLTARQEISLAKRIERGDLKAKELLVNSNLRLVASNARRYQNQGLPLADLVQEGMLGLIRASEKFDWRKGFRFSTYATLWIRQAIQRGLENSGRTIRLPVHVAQRARKVGRIERELAVRLGREPTIAEVADEAGLEIEAVQEVRDQRQALTSLDQMVGEDGDTALGDLLPSDTEAPEDRAWESERERIVRHAIAQLPDTERRVITLRFGTDREEPQTLTAIGRRLGFSAERASQLEQRALRKLAESPALAALREAA
ncbi:MAG TPA: sigma-70 family RNA polymerase sigma factor [Solirubrobacteraceae bacterium]|jgi:RNA polymerase primary sigma factor|nr:sigma-70 family RNA polymerase sigma factor [Solirubrobacteraceae bacterium]